MGCLSGVRVIEWGDFISAPYCAKLLGGLGADVVKIEPPAGDSARAHGPFPDDAPDPEASGLFLYLNTDKKSVVLDPEEAAQRDKLFDLLAGADIFVANAPIADRRRLGLDYDALAARFPHLIVVGVSIFGDDGELAGTPGTDLDACALSGGTYSVGEPGRPPLTLPYFQTEYQAGLNAAAAACLALLARDRGGAGQHVDVAAADVMANYVGTMGFLMIYHGALEMRRDGRRACGSAGPYPYTILPCKDGDVCILGRARREWDRMVQAMGAPDWAKNPRYQDLVAMGRDYPDEVDELMKPWLARHTRAELLAIAAEYNFAVGPLQTVDEVVATEQFRVRDFFARTPHPRLGAVTMPGVPYRFSATPVPPPGPAPALGADTDAVLAAPPRPAPPAAAAPALAAPDAATAAKPLAGLRVLDFGWVWSGPMVTSTLSEFGAEVIKVEHGERLDNQRLVGRPIVDGEKLKTGPAIELAPIFHQTNHGKKSITLDIKTPRGRELLDALVAKSDILLENLSPGALARSGIAYDRLRGINPRLIMISMSSVGQEGPLRAMRGYATILSAFTGYESVIGYPGEAPLGNMNFGLSDPGAASFATLALLAALRHRDRRGEGQYIDLSQCEALLCGLPEPIADYFFNGRVAGPHGNVHPHRAPHGVYPAAGADSWLTLAVADDAQWRALVDLMDAPGWARDPALAEARGRLAARDDLDARLADWTRTQDRAALVARLREAGIAASPVIPVQAQWAMKHFDDRGIRHRVAHPLSGPENIYSAPWRMSVSRPAVTASAPLLGADNDAVFGGLLGLPADEIAALKDARVIA